MKWSDPTRSCPKCTPRGSCRATPSSSFLRTPHTTSQGYVSTNSNQSLAHCAAKGGSLLEKCHGASDCLVPYSMLCRFCGKDILVTLGPLCSVNPLPRSGLLKACLWNRDPGQHWLTLACLRLKTFFGKSLFESLPLEGHSSHGLRSLRAPTRLLE